MSTKYIYPFIEKTITEDRNGYITDAELSKYNIVIEKNNENFINNSEVEVVSKIISPLSLSLSLFYSK